MARVTVSLLGGAFLREYRNFVYDILIDNSTIYIQPFNFPYGAINTLFVN